MTCVMLEMVVPGRAMRQCIMGKLNSPKKKESPSMATTIKEFKWKRKEREQRWHV